MPERDKGFPAWTLARHLNPWNWCMQALAVLLAVPGLALHSTVLLAAASILAVASLWDFRLPPMRDVGFSALERRVAAAIAAEHRLYAGPWTRTRRVKAMLLALAGLAMIPGLWLLGGLGLLLVLAVLVLVRVALQNKSDGIAP